MSRGTPKQSVHSLYKFQRAIRHIPVRTPNVLLKPNRVSDRTGRTLVWVPEAPFGVRCTAGFPCLRIERAYTCARFCQLAVILTTIDDICKYFGTREGQNKASVGSQLGYKLFDTQIKSSKKLRWKLTFVYF